MPGQIIPRSGLAHDRFQQLAALLDPDAVEGSRVGTFTYAVGPGVTKYMLLGYNTYINPDTGARYDVRTPNDPLPVSNATIKGAASDSAAVFLDPALPMYSNARDTYLDRMKAITQLTTKWIHLAATDALFLPGPYGAIITSVVSFGQTNVALGINGSTSGAPIISAPGATTIRAQRTMTLPVTKGSVRNARAGGTVGVLTYVLLPSNWSVAADPNTYIFRDDFTGASLDTAVKWNKTESTVGNVQVNTDFAWCKLRGNGTWGANGAFSKTSTARANGRVFMCDVQTDLSSGSNVIMVGWHDGAGYSYTDFAHGINFTTGGTLQVYENGVQRGTGLGTGYTAGHTYRVRLTLGASNNCVYEIQGGSQYPAIGSGSWTSITPGTSSSVTTPLSAGMSINNATNCYVSDVRVY